MASLKSFVTGLSKCNTRTPAMFVIGNEASDADSIITAIMVAYLRAQGVPPAERLAKGQTPIIPVVACPRADLKFRPETVKAFSDLGLPADELLYVDEVDLAAAHAAGGMQLILTDHNVGSAQEKLGLGKAVVEIIDHHEDSGTNLHVTGDMRRIEFGEAKGFKAKQGMGSACTAVTEMYQKEAPSLLQDDLMVRQLLAAVILLDTANLENEAKTTERDIAAANTLFSMGGLPPQRDFYEGLQGAKTDPAYWKQVSTFDLLRADYKAYTGKGDFPYGVASVNGGTGGLIELATARGTSDIEEAFIRFSAEFGTGVLLAMCVYPSPEEGWGRPRRDLMVWATESEGKLALLNFLKTQELLELKEVASAGQVSVFEQHNTASSRKQLAPLLESYYG